MDANSIMRDIETRRTVWLGGEMEFPWGLTCPQACEIASRIAEDRLSADDQHRFVDEFLQQVDA